MNILKRVPVKSLMRFKCVSKEWLNLPTNPYFIKQQLQHSTRNAALLLQRIHRQPPPISFSVCLVGPHNNLIHQSHLSHIALLDVKILDSCNGLLCLRNNTALSILNPATHQIRPVPTPTVMPFHDVGFGFSSLTDDYKIVRISMCVIFKQPKVDRAEVYSLTSGSWREINAVKLHNLGLVSRSVAITGTIFWLASRTFSSTHYEFVVSFDIGRELFTLMIGPQMPSTPSPTFNNYELVVCNDELAMFCNCIARNFVSCSFDLWVLKDFNCDYDDDRRDGGGESWVKMYSVGPFSGLVYPLSLWKDEIVCRERLKVENGGDSVIGLFNPVSKILKQLQPDRDEFCYVASRSTLPLIKYLRVRVDALPRNSPLTLAPTVFLRRFCEEVRGSFLDKSEVADRVISCVKNFQKVDPAKVTPNAHFQNDLGLDSLDAVEIVMALEEEFGFEIPDNEADKINSIKHAVDFIASHPQAK